jgi:hypothetical protein
MTAHGIRNATPASSITVALVIALAVALVGLTLAAMVLLGSVSP